MAHHEERVDDRARVYGEFHRVYGGDQFAELD